MQPAARRGHAHSHLVSHSGLACFIRATECSVTADRAILDDLFVPSTLSAQLWHYGMAGRCCLFFAAQSSASTASLISPIVQPCPTCTAWTSVGIHRLHIFTANPSLHGESSRVWERLGKQGGRLCQQPTRSERNESVVTNIRTLSSFK